MILIVIAGPQSLVVNGEEGAAAFCVSGAMVLDPARQRH